jgi:hypothetical protein
VKHPNPDVSPDLTPIKTGEVWVNPVTGERAPILELHWENHSGRMTAELTALVGGRVMGEHYLIEPGVWHEHGSWRRGHDSLF